MKRQRQMWFNWKKKKQTKIVISLGLLLLWHKIPPIIIILFVIYFLSFSLERLIGKIYLFVFFNVITELQLHVVFPVLEKTSLSIKPRLDFSRKPLNLACGFEPKRIWNRIPALVKSIYLMDGQKYQAGQVNCGFNMAKSYNLR